MKKIKSDRGDKPIIDKTGQVFGRLVAVSLTRTSSGRTAWTCECSCGNTVTVDSTNLRGGRTESCGCLQRERTGNANRTHGEENTRLYRTWLGMRNRCLNGNEPAYKNYGGRGISIYLDWGSFENFRDWARASGYEDHLTIERVDVNGNYEPANCTWIPRSEQTKNRRDSVFIEWNGKRQIMADWAREMGMSDKILWYRIKNGWSAEDALTRPARKLTKKT